MIPAIILEHILNRVTTAAANRVYFVGRNGVTYVIKPSQKFEILAVNKLDDRFDCSPAFVDDEMFLKGKENL